MVLVFCCRVRQLSMVFKISVLSMRKNVQDASLILFEFVFLKSPSLFADHIIEQLAHCGVKWVCEWFKRMTWNFFYTFVEWNHRIELKWDKSFVYCTVYTSISVQVKFLILPSHARTHLTMLMDRLYNSLYCPKTFKYWI